MTKKRFRGIVTEIAGRARVELPFDAVKVWGPGGRIPVRGTINGVPIRTSLLPSAFGGHYLPVNITVRRAAKIIVRERVHIELENEIGPRIVEVPQFIDRAFKRVPVAHREFQLRPYWQRKEIVEWISNVKKEETKLRRIEKVIGILVSQRKS